MTLSDVQKYLQVVQDTTDVFCSSNLWRPEGNRGAFGGQLFAHLIDAASQTAPNGFYLHSMHSFFLESSDPAVVIKYEVKRLRDGQSFCTRMVTATQNSVVKLVGVASFKRKETKSFDYQKTGNEHIKSCLPAELVQRYEYVMQDAVFKGPEIPALAEKKYFLGKVEKEPKIIETRQVYPPPELDMHIGVAHVPEKCVWIRHPEPLEALDKRSSVLVLAFASDQYFLVTALKAFGLNAFSGALKYFATLDNSMWMHTCEIDMSLWHMYEVKTVRVADGRALIKGFVYSKHGVHVATVVQEGILRLKRDNTHHTILLFQKSLNKATRSYSDFETVAEAIEFILSQYERKLKELNPSVPEISYEVEDLYSYLDKYQDLAALVLDPNSKMYVPHDKEWIKTRLYNHLYRKMK